MEAIMAQSSESDASGHGRHRARQEGHDWHSQDYVTYWMTKDRGREARRRPLLQRMIEAAPFDKETALRVLDVGGGYGAVSERVLQAFPNAQVTLQDFSEVMLDEARDHLAAYEARMRYAFGDLRDRLWTEQFEEPFDLVVSAIAIHNLMDMPTIAACYREILGVLKPGGCFLDCDHFDHVGDIEGHIKALKLAGYAQVECLWYESPSGIIRSRA
jgi:ubiquinone/menaquinone biosynthesis C-methylase UbiE